MKHLIFVVAATSLVAACIPDVMNTKPEVRGLAGAAPVQTLTDPASGADATLRPGGVLKVIFKSNPTTGYYWQLQNSDDAAVALVTEDYIADPAPEGLVGSGGHQVFVLEGLSKGRASLVFNYQRAESDQVDRRRVDVKVIE